MTPVRSVLRGPFSNGASLKDIQQAAFWSNPNSFVSCYLKDVVVGEASCRGRGFEVLCFGILWFRANQEDSLGFALFFGGVFILPPFSFIFLCQSSTLIG